MDALCRVADDLRAEIVGDDVTYVINRNLNFTNVCYVGCRFCAFAQREQDAESYTLTLDEVADRVEEAWDWGATEVCMQGGIHPDLPGIVLLRPARRREARVPQMHVHAFSPMEVLNGATKLGIASHEFLAEARPTGSARSPAPRPRSSTTTSDGCSRRENFRRTPGRRSSARRTAWASDPAPRSCSATSTRHRTGWPTCGASGRIQADTGGFTEFVPLPFVHQNAPIYLAGKARPGATFEENLRMHAVARILLDGLIPNIQVSWVKLGVDACQAILRSGANDFGGTLMEETISRMAGAEWGIVMTPDQFDDAIRAIDRVPGGAHDHVRARRIRA